jgi:diaminohydroxyphosphoribosylaminopyrimidine deaminase / 5-amino-6-(5-phosphoribosylamino)uracil reductase
MSLTPVEEAALRTALEIAADPSAPPGPNPRVGCVILDERGVHVGQGFHRGAGTPHAEVVALQVSGSRAKGGTALVTLEPCRHTGRTGPCTDELIRAGVSKVIFAVEDPGEESSRGAEVLRSAGIEVVQAEGLLADRARELLTPWVFAVTQGRPYVTLKVAASLDGRVAAQDGSSHWITGDTARADVHSVRSQVDAIVIGSGTVAIDNPSLTARNVDGTLMVHQPLRVIVGMSDLPVGATLSTVHPGESEILHLRTHDVRNVLATLGERSVRHVLVEGGPTLAAAFVRAQVVDRIEWYTAPVLFGSGIHAMGDLSITNIAQVQRWRMVSVEAMGEDAKIIAVADRSSTNSSPGQEA